MQTTLDNTVPLSEVFFPSVVVCNINQIRKSFFEELGFYENDTLVRIMYEDFIKGTMDADWEASKVTKDPKRNAFYEVRTTFFLLLITMAIRIVEFLIRGYKNILKGNY